MEFLLRAQREAIVRLLVRRAYIETEKMEEDGTHRGKAIQLDADKYAVFPQRFYELWIWRIPQFINLVWR